MSCPCQPVSPCLPFQFPVWRTSHTVKWEGVWRELGCLSRTASFAVRKESGHSLKSSLSVRMLQFCKVSQCWGTKLASGDTPYPWEAVKLWGAWLARALGFLGQGPGAL